MSAELLRRAATRLRDSASAAEVQLPLVIGGHSATWETAMDGWLGHDIGAYAAMMSPPVALALADVFENLADCMVVAGAARDQRLEAVARAVLREQP